MDMILQATSDIRFGRRHRASLRRISRTRRTGILRGLTISIDFTAFGTFFARSLTVRAFHRLLSRVCASDFVLHFSAQFLFLFLLLSSLLLQLFSSLSLSLTYSPSVTRQTNRRAAASRCPWASRTAPHCPQAESRTAPNRGWRRSPTPLHRPPTSRLIAAFEVRFR